MSDHQLPDVGDTVVHPQHGTATVEGFEERDLGGKTVRYAVLKLVDDSMTIRVPVDTLDDAGVRDVVAGAQLNEVMQALADDPSPVESWRKRRARNQSRLRSGDLEQVAAMVRDLTSLDATKRLSPTEKRMLMDARQLLSRELAAASDTNADAAQDLIDGALANDETSAI